jgi:hypothetical protein
MHNESGEEDHDGRRAWLWMLACCVPMIAIIVLIAIGFWSSH